MAPMHRPRLLLYSMYPLDQGRWGPTVRIAHLRDELARLADLDVIAGYRGARRWAAGRYALGGRLRGLDGIYVESSSFLPAETDLAFLGLARALGIPVLTYVRDAYQLFPEYRTSRSLKSRLASAAFRPMIRALRAVSTRLATPTEGLARAIGVPDAALLPPGAPAPVDVARAPGADALLFVGDARLPAHGADRLIRAVGMARERGVAVTLTVVCRPGQEPPGHRPDWLEIRRAEGNEIHALLPQVLATVIPRPRGPYNDLALPIKLFDYLSYGRPLLVTECAEQARVVRDADAGVVTGADPRELADAIARLVSAGGAQLDRWSANARRAATEASWADRATRILELLGRR
jgi:glycosyltransferase involved in cell wall biosynthesis